jgi:hypothetical protein
MRETEEIEHVRKRIGTPDEDILANTRENKGTMYEVIATLKEIEQEVSSMAAHFRGAISGPIGIVIFLLSLIAVFIVAHVVHHW